MGFPPIEGDGFEVQVMLDRLEEGDVPLLGRCGLGADGGEVDGDNADSAAAKPFRDGHPKAGFAHLAGSKNVRVSALLAELEEVFVRGAGDVSTADAWTVPPALYLTDCTISSISDLGAISLAKAGPLEDNQRALDATLLRVHMAVKRANR